MVSLKQLDNHLTDTLFIELILFFEASPKNLKIAWNY